MDVALGKSLDAWFGRLIDLVAADPARRAVRLTIAAEPAPPPAKPASEEKTVAVPGKKAAARKPGKKPPARKPAPSKAARPRPTPEALEEAVLRAGPPPRKAALDAEDRQVLAALSELADGAGVPELAAKTGQTPAALRRRLRELSAAGHVERVAAGLLTRFRRAGPAGNDDDAASETP